MFINTTIIALIMLASSSNPASAFTNKPIRTLHHRRRLTSSFYSSSSSSSLSMAITPIGPFCPFRSTAALAMEPSMETLNTTPDFATEMARINLDMQVGETPDPNRLRTVASGISSAVDGWEDLLTNLRTSRDFQTLEYAKLTEAHLERHGQTTDEIASTMRWQAGCMRAMADGQPPPFPPPGLDLAKMMQDSQQYQEEGKSPPSMSAMSAAEKITSTPFTGDEKAFESDTVRNEYEALCRDHSALIDMGGSYADFDAIGKVAFLDQIEQVEMRWDVFFARFKLLGQLNQDFVKQCNGFLDSMGLDEQQFRELLQETHNLMRRDADKERNAF